MDGKTARGASSPAKPALHIPEPLSTTRAATSSSDCRWGTWVGHRERRTGWVSGAAKQVQEDCESRPRASDSAHRTRNRGRRRHRREQNPNLHSLKPRPHVTSQWHWKWKWKCINGERCVPYLEALVAGWVRSSPSPPPPLHYPSPIHQHKWVVVMKHRRARHVRRQNQ